MDRESGRLHDSVLSNLSNSFFDGLPACHSLSSNSISTCARRRDFTRQLDEKREFYISAEYGTALLKCCNTAPRELLSAASTAVRSTRRHKPDIGLPDVPDVAPGQVSFYFLGFLTVKVCDVTVSSPTLLHGTLPDPFLFNVD